MRGDFPDESLVGVAGWDENQGVGCSGVGCPSTAYQSRIGGIPSESFSLYAPSIPEPSTVLDLFGSGAFGLAGLMFNGRLRQKLFGGKVRNVAAYTSNRAGR